MASIRKPTCAGCWNASPSTPSIASPSCCPGTSTLTSQLPLRSPSRDQSYRKCPSIFKWTLTAHTSAVLSLRFDSDAYVESGGLEGLFDRIRRSMKPNAVFIFDEYVGPRRFQWSDRQLQCINAAIELLPSRLNKDVQTGKLRERVTR